MRTDRRLAWALLSCLLWACGPRSMQARIANGERRSEQASAVLYEAERALRDLEPDRAEARIKEAADLLADPDVDLYPEESLLRSRLAEARAQVANCREERARKDLEAEVQRHREGLERYLAELDSALEVLAGKDAGTAQAGQVRASAQQVARWLEDSKRLEAQDAAWAEEAQQAREQVQEALARSAVVEKTQELVAGPVKDRAEAMTLADQAKAERNLAQRLGLYTQARQRFAGCADEAQRLFDAAPGLEKVSLELDGKTLPAKAVASSCLARLDKLDRILEKLLKAQASASKKATRKAGRKKQR